MVLKSGVSSFMSLLLVLVMFAAMQLFAETLRSSQLLTIVGGFIGSLVFVLLITFVNNLERTLFGGEFCSGVFPEVITCILIACTFSATVHRVCGTTWSIPTSQSCLVNPKIIISSHYVSSHIEGNFTDTPFMN
ncbi:Protein KRTCAP2 like [Schistosoma japonicum]|nr:Protein KRTCAP2 like [Schistosoma japonicum]